MGNVTNVLTPKEISNLLKCKRGLDISTKAIKQMGEKLGCSAKHRAGNKVGYHKSFCDLLVRHLYELVQLDKELKKENSKRVNVPPKGKHNGEPNYYTYNGERDNNDYGWEKNESTIKESNMDKQVLTGLWLDDSRRDPNKFLNKKNDSSESGAVVRDWYNQNMSNNEIQWTAVSNYWEFKNYILKNGVPDFVSLDHDLGKDHQTGALRDSGQHAPSGTDCAMFLVSYCLRKHIPLPKHYIHSANDNQRVFISKVFRLGKMGKDPLEGVDLNNDQEIGQAADNFKQGIVGTKDMIKNGQLGTADRLARMRGLKDTNDLFRKKKNIYRENKQIIRVTEQELHKVIRESIDRILKERRMPIRN